MNMANKIKFNEDYPKIDKSLELYNRLKNLVPAGTQTLAKGITQHVFGVAPIFLKSGNGSKVIDVDGNEYLDYTMGVGPLSLGYQYPAVDNAIKEQLNEGITFSLVHPLELEVAELFNKIIPNCERVRFSKTGADVVSAAIRLARAYTGKSKILCCGYHGWHDWYISVTDKNSGIPDGVKDLSFTINYNDFDSVLNSIDEEIAAIILEPVVFDEPKDDFLQKLRELCTQKGIILIFDEMWTGFRMALGGAQEYFNIKADLAVFSKACANGMPLSVLTGRAEIIDLLNDDVFFFTTFGGETLSLAAAKATINEMITNNVIHHLYRIGNKLKTGINKILRDLDIDYISVKGYDFRLMINIDNKYSNSLLIKSVLQQELLRWGILWSGYHNISFSHSDEDIDYTLKAYNYCLKEIDVLVKNNQLESFLRGKPLQPVFRKVGNFNTKPMK